MDTKEGCVDKLSLALVVLKGTPFLLCFFWVFFRSAAASLFEKPRSSLPSSLKT